MNVKIVVALFVFAARQEKMVEWITVSFQARIEPVLKKMLMNTELDDLRITNRSKNNSVFSSSLSRDRDHFVLETT